MKILTISTSLAPTSRSRAMARTLHARLDQTEGLEATFIDLRDHPLPLCDADKCWSDPQVRQVRGIIAQAEGIVMAAPVYNYDASAAAKNLIELTGKAWEEKVVGFICAAGGRNSYMSIMGMANSLMLDFRSVIVPRFVYATGDSFDEQYNLTDPDVHDRLAELAEVTAGMTRALRTEG